jgi:hypothetical protein
MGWLITLAVALALILTEACYYSRQIGKGE